MTTILTKKTDQLGIISSVLCIVHCIATPFFLMTFAGASLPIHGSQEWWRGLDLLFIGISLFAVFKTIQYSDFRWIKVSLFFSFILLTFFVLNERFEGIEFPFDMIYFPASALALLHLVNLRRCRCKAGCCNNDQSKHNAL